MTDIEWYKVERILTTCNVKGQKVDSLDFTAKLPDNFTLNLSVEGFNVGSNEELKFLPQNLGEIFPNLDSIQIYKTGLIFVDNKSLKNLTVLKVLHLSENKIQMVDSGAFEDLVELEFLSLANNQIEYLNSKTFANLKKLKNLGFAINKIEYLSSSIFKNLENLEDLSMELNQIKVLPNNIFGNLKKVKQISLLANEIKVIHEKLFENNNKLASIWLGYNKIKEISSKIFIGKDNLRFFHLLRNECIDRLFWNTTAVEMKQEVPKKCLPEKEKVDSWVENMMSEKN